jgi:hypothetical protein
LTISSTWHCLLPTSTPWRCRSTRLPPLAFVYVDGNPNGGVPPRKWHCVAYFNASEYDLLPGPEAYPELRSISIPSGVYTSTKGMGRATAAITGGALRPVASGLGIGNMGSVGNYGSTMGVLDIGGVSSVMAGEDADWNPPGDDTGIEIDAYGSGDSAKGVGSTNGKTYAAHSQEPPARFDLEPRSSNTSTLPVQHECSHGRYGRLPTYSGSLSSTPTSTSTSPDSPNELTYSSGSYAQGPTLNTPSTHDGDHFHGTHVYSHSHSHSHLGSATTFSRSASYPSQPTLSMYPTHMTLSPSTVLPLPIPRPGAGGSRAVRSSEDVKAINAFRLAL